MMKEREVSKLLDTLDVDPDDHDKLGDILDADHSASITIIELVNGLQRLRGYKLKRSDVVSIDLMVRNLQEQVSELSQEVLQRLPPAPPTSTGAAPTSAGAP